MNILGVTPFFAPNNFSSRGKVLVNEITSRDALARASRMVNEQLLEGAPLTPTSAFVVSFLNVSSDNDPKVILFGRK